jgi:glycosyltransferase involved in cell wall biosynthesis
MKIAIVHEFLHSKGGAENVLKEVISIFPEADIFCLNYREKILEDLKIKKVNSSFITQLPAFLKFKTKFFLPFFPMLIEDFDLNEYDLVISLSNSFAHGVLTNPDTVHVCYYHSPMRYAWDSYFSYIEENKFNFITKFFVKNIIAKLRRWDLIASNRPDFRIANSQTVSNRIKKYYRQNTDKIIFPPVENHPISKDFQKQEFYIVVSRLSAYKKIDHAVKACVKLGKKLKVIGEGPEIENLKKFANSNIEFLGRLDDDAKFVELQKAKAFLFPGIDDFGIAPVEAMMVGTPVIAFGQGGATETVIQNKTGLLYSNQSIDCLKETIIEFEKKADSFKPEVIMNHAKKFNSENFRTKFKSFIDELIQKT